MVQVDVIWSYAFGASFAAASARTLQKSEDKFHNKVFTRLLLFLAVLFAPSGVWLLSAFPRWETMQVANQIADLPPWLMTAFAVTNITQGIVGYYVGYRLVKKGLYYAANVNVAASWTLFWFVLVSGWDTTGWQRFLYDGTMNNDIPWSPGMHQGLAFFTGHVFQTLAGMGVFFAPALYYGLIEANYDDVAKDPTIAVSERPGLLGITTRTVGTMFSIYLFLAIAASFVVRGFVSLTGSVLIGYLIGAPVAIALGWNLLFKRGRPMHLWLQGLYVREP